MATGGLTLDDDPEFCSLCLDHFQDPKFLPCHHTFCATCIEDLARLHSPGPFPCPLCRKATTLPQDGVSSLQENFYVKPKDRKVYCRVHRDEKLKYFCIDCEEVVCCECRLTSHINHAANGIDSVITQKKAELKADEGRLKTGAAGLEQQFDTSQLNMDSVVEEFLRHMHAGLIMHPRELLLELPRVPHPMKNQGFSYPFLDNPMKFSYPWPTERQYSLQEMNDMIKKLDNLTIYGSATDVVAVIKKMRIDVGVRNL